MTESVEIKIDLDAQGWDARYPCAKVYIDDQLIFDKMVTATVTVPWSGNLDEGDHVIAIEMYGKRDGDTVQDKDGNIVDDVLLNIGKVFVDEVDLDLLTWSKSKYMPLGEYSPDLVEDCVDLGWNGRWELTFSSPVYLWLLDNL